MTEVEQEWSDDDRTQLLALGLYEDGLCACGLPESVATDKANVFTFDDKVCPVCAGVARYVRVQHDRDQRSTREGAAPADPLPADGRRTYVRQMSPDEVEERRNKRPPRP